MKKTGLAFLLFLFFCGLALGENFTVKLRSSIFIPQDNFFEEIYGEGVAYGIEIDIPIWKKLDLWTSGNYFVKQGKLTFTQDSTKVKILPIEWGIRYRFLSKKICLYTGIGLGYVSLRESNFIGVVDTKKFGYNLSVGGFLSLFHNVIFDVFIRYSWYKVNPTTIEVNIGGYDIGIGIGYAFGEKKTTPATIQKRRR